MFYPDNWGNCYERLIRYYPRFYREVREMDAILHTHGQLGDGLEDGVEHVMDDSFVDFADEATITQWEKILNISYNNIVGKTLDERRGQVKSILIGSSGNLSASLLVSMIKAYTEAEVDIEFTNYPRSQTEGANQALYITMKRDGDQNISVSDILYVLSRAIPAHLLYFVFETVNTILDCSGLEHITLVDVAIAMHIKAWGAVLLDGTERLDGHSNLDSGRFGRYRMGVSLDVGICAPNNIESITGAVYIAYDMWKIDGDVSLDGSRLLDAAYRKEDL